jgi:UDP-N-acetylmuramoylalanine--D-glutamate ligase
MINIATDKKVVIVGLGKTGLSCVRYLKNKGHHVTVMDSRENPPGLAVLAEEFSDVECVLGAFDAELLCGTNEIILSPGVPLAHESLKKALASGVMVRGDIDLFAEAANAPIIAITGSNGKSTVTTLVGEMAVAAGINVGVGGNLGTPSLDLLDNDCQLYVLELSSFQLETTHALNAQSATILNISDDHMDRYSNRMAYLTAKQRVFRGAKNVVVNADEVLSQPLVTVDMTLQYFGLNQPDLNKFSVIDVNGDRYLAKGYEPILALKELKVRGEHNISNVLAAMALASTAGIPIEAMKSALRKFKGLAHRCQHIRTINNVDYVNDSKGTNPGAVVTAVNSLGKEISGKVILIAGGDSKGADLQPLLKPMSEYGKTALLIGKDAERLASVLNGVTHTEYKETLESAVTHASKIAVAGDVVLLSPACASMDMFDNYEHRGDIFVREVLSI